MILLHVLAAIAVYMAIDATRRRRALQRALRTGVGTAPIDAPTHLLTRSALEPRFDGMRKRADRFGSELCMSLWTLDDGSPDDFGLELSHRVRFPNVAVRLATNVFCVITPETDRQERGDLYLRVLQAGEGNGMRGAEVRYPHEGTDLPALLELARRRIAAQQHTVRQHGR